MSAPAASTKSSPPAKAAEQTRARSPAPGGNAINIASATGNQAMQQLLGAYGVRPKLSISQPDDPDEQEADDVAARVIDAPAPVAIHRKCDACASGAAPCSSCADEETIHRKKLPSAATAAPKLASAPMLGRLGSGHALPSGTRTFFESRLGYDLGSVRVHSDPGAAHAARVIQARAYTVGHDIVFARGEYVPESNDGRRLLAHELAHVLQADRAPRIRREPKSGDGDDAAAPKKTEPEAEPAVPDGVDCRMAGGYRFCANREQVHFMVRKMVKEQGVAATYDAIMNMQLVAQGGYSFPLASGAAMGMKVQSPADVVQRMARNDPAELALDEIHTFTAFLAKFRGETDDTLTAVLRDSELSVETERTRYGIEGSGGERGTYSQKETQSTTAMMAAAQDLLEKNKKIGQIYAQQTKYIRPMAFAPAEVTNKVEYARLGAELKKEQDDYDKLAAAAKMRYPILAAVLENRGGSFGEADATSRLGKVAGGGGAGAGVLGWMLDERTDNIKKVRTAFGEGHVQTLKLPQIVALTKIRLHVEADSPENRAVDDMISSMNWNDTIKQIALAVVALALGLIAALPSGGSSLVAAGTFVAGVAAAAISTQMLVKSVEEYDIKNAEARSDLDRAKAISSDVPSMFWLALDVVGAIADLAAAAKAFKALVVVVREALAAKTAVEIADSTRALKQIANAQERATPALGERVAASVEHMRGGSSSEAMRTLGVAGEHEAAAVEQAAKSAAHEVDASVSKQATKFGGEVKVSRSGWLFSCASPCSVLREKYVAQLASDTKLRDELAALEKAAEEAVGNPGKLQDIAGKAADLEERLRKIVPPGAWESPLKSTPDYADLLKRRGTAAFALDRKPPGWTGGLEARFRHGAEAEEGYRFVLEADGTLRYDRLSRDLPERVFDTATGAFAKAPERAGAVALESEEELAKLAQLGKGATTTSEWLSKIRNGVPELKGLTDAQLSRVLAHSPNLDHMRGALLEELAGNVASSQAKSFGKGVEYISPDRIRDAAKAQLTDGMMVRKLPDGSYEVVAFVESKAGAASAEQLGASRKTFNSLSEGELSELRMEAVEEFRIRSGLDALPSEKVLKEHPEEIQALMRDIHSSDMGQVRKSMERLMPGADNQPVKVIIDGIGEVPVRVSPSKTTALVATPTNVGVDKTVSALGGEGLKVKALGTGISGDRLEAVARQLRAEAVTNAPKASP